MSKSSTKVAHDILRYMRENPRAADTLEGIAEWWLRDKYSLTKVRQMLAELVEEGLIVKLEGKDSRPIYRTDKAD